MKTHKITFLFSIFLMGLFTLQMQAQEQGQKRTKTKIRKQTQAKQRIHQPDNIANAKDTGLKQSYTGLVTKEELSESPYTMRWFNQRYDRYEADAESMKTIKKNINKYDIEVYMGMWCPDSHREVPGIYKLLEEAGYNMDKLKVYTMNRGKRTEANYEKGKSISRVPTIVFYKKGKEVNRFVERPRETLAKDIAKIVSGKEYKNTYAR